MKVSTVSAGIILAIYQCSVAAGTTTPFNASFDTLTAVPEEGRLSPVGIYQGINYENFDLGDPAIALAGLTPHSRPNYIFGVGSPSSPAAQVASAPTKFISLSSLYYGCQTNLAQAAAAIPEACTITTTGFRAGVSKAVVSQTFTFSPAAGTTAPLAFGKFGAAFQGLTNITYTQNPSELNIVLDNIIGTTTT